MTDRITELFGLPADAVHLEEALTHPSFANEQRSAAHNQRLEFLGDSVLGFCVRASLAGPVFPEAFGYWAAWLHCGSHGWQLRRHALSAFNFYCQFCCWCGWLIFLLTPLDAHLAGVSPKAN